MCPDCNRSACDLDSLLRNGAYWDVASDDAFCSGPLEQSFPAGKEPATGYVCPEHQWCVGFGNPNYGFSNFDDIASAWLYIFHVMSTEGWADGTYRVMSAVGRSTWTYFVTLVIFGTYLFMPLYLAILFSYYVREREKQEETIGKGRVLTVDRPESQEEHQVAATEAYHPHSTTRSENGVYVKDTNALSVELSNNPSLDSEPEQIKQESTDRGDTQLEEVKRREEDTRSADESRKGTKERFRCMVRSHTFENVGHSLIVLNIIVLASQYDGMPERVREACGWVNSGITFYFVFEVSSKVAVYGPTRFLQDSINCFDAVVVGAALIEIIYAYATPAQGRGFLSALRAFRLLHLLRLMRGWKELNSVITTLLRSLASLSHLTLLFLLFIYIASLLAKQMFGYRIAFCDQYVSGAEQECPIRTKRMNETLRFHAPLPEAVLPGKRNVLDECPSHRDCYIGCDPQQEDFFVLLNNGLTTSSGVCRFYPFRDPMPAHLVRVGPAEVTSESFDTFWESFLHIFSIVTLENWDDMMYEVAAATTPWSMIFFIACVGLGTYIVLNLFVAVILSNFRSTASRSETFKENGSAKERPQAQLRKRKMRMNRSNASTKRKLLGLSQALASGSIVRRDPDGKEKMDSSLPQTSKSPIEGVNEDKHDDVHSAEDVEENYKAKRYEQDQIENLERQAGSEADAANGSNHKAADGQKRWPPSENVNGMELHGYALLMLSPQNWLRERAARIVTSKWFENVVLALVIINAIILAADSPTQDPDTAARLMHINNVLAIVFAVEISIRIMVQGFVMHRNSYLRNVWNVIDFIVVAAGITGFMLTYAPTTRQPSQLSSIRALRALRTLRPLRVAHRAPGLRLVTNAFFKAFPAIGNFLMVILFVYLIFGVIGMQLFQGKYYACYESPDGQLPLSPREYSVSEMDRSWCKEDFHTVFYPNLTDAVLDGFNFNGVTPWIEGDKVALSGRWNCSMIDTAPNMTIYDPESKMLTTWFSLQWECMAEAEDVADKYNASIVRSFLRPFELEHSWRKPLFPGVHNFDNIGQTMLTLFELSTFELWLWYMHFAVSVRGEGKQPVEGANPQYALYFLVFEIIVGLYITNLFVGVVIDKFNEIKEKEQRNLILTEAQRRWVEVRKLMHVMQPPKSFQEPQQSKLRRNIFHLVLSPHFEYGVFAIIFVNIVFMCSYHNDQPSYWDTVLFVHSCVFTGAFVVEVVLKCIAFGVCEYWRDEWNKFDFIVTVASLLGIIIRAVASIKADFLSFLRIFRVFRVFRLIPHSKGLRKVSHTLLCSLPALWNVGLLMLILLWVYALLGMNLFGVLNQGPFVTRYANFDTFGNAMLTLFRMTIGEDWNGIMWDVMNRDNCVKVVHDDGSVDYVAHDTDVSDSAETRDRCGPFQLLTLLYFLSYIVIVAYVMASLVTAVVVDSFQEIAKEDFEGTLRPVTRDKLISFTDAWARMDPDGEHVIDASQLAYLMTAVDQPLGTRGSLTPLKDAQYVVLELNIPIDNNLQVTFSDTLLALANRAAGTELPAQLESELSTPRKQNNLSRIQSVKSNNSSMKGLTSALDSMNKQHFSPAGSHEPSLAQDEERAGPYTVSHFQAVLFVQAAMRGLLYRRRATIDRSERTYQWTEQRDADGGEEHRERTDGDHVSRSTIHGASNDTSK